jgi:hypothetical protein
MRVIYKKKLRELKSKLKKVKKNVGSKKMKKKE